MKRIYLIFVTIFCVIFMIFFSHKIDNYKNYKKLQNEFEKNPVNFWLDKLNTTDYKKIVMNLDKINKFNQDIIENVEDVIDFNSYDEKISVKILKKMRIATIPPPKSLVLIQPKAFLSTYSG